MQRSILVHLAIAICIGAGGFSHYMSGQQRSPRFAVGPLSDANGHVGLGLALRRLTTAGTLMNATAHPDDENNAVLALYARGQGMRVALVSATRGDGGQNEIGPELFDAIGVLRTEELLAAHRWDGAEQYFTRAVDFGYSFSPEETLEKWGHQEIVGDYVRMIRTIRPDVIVSLSPSGTGGGQHHQVSARLALEAFNAAGDPARFPEQIAEGLRPWQAKKLYQPAGGIGVGPGAGSAGRGGGAGPPPAGRGATDAMPPPAPVDPAAKYATLDTSVYDPVMGCTIGEIGGIAASMHKCQGRSPLQAFPTGQGAVRYRLAATVLESQRDKNETSLFDGIDTSVDGLARFAGSAAPPALKDGLAAIAARAAAAQKSFQAQGAVATLPDLLGGLTAVRALRTALLTLPVSEDGRFEIDLRLHAKEDQFQHAIVIAHGLRIDALANDGVVMAGQPIRVTANVANRGPEDIAIARVTLSGFDGAARCPSGPIRSAPAFSCASDLRIPANAALTNPYWKRPPDAGRATYEPNAPQGLPFRPSPFRARFDFEIGGTPVMYEMPVQYRYEGDLASGEKRMEVKVVPALSVHIEPAVMIVPVKLPVGADRRKDVRVTVENDTRGAATASVSLKVPPGWRVTPTTAPVSFTLEGESSTVRFMVTPPASPSVGAFAVQAEATVVKGQDLSGGERFTDGYQAIEYPHTERRHKIIPAETAVKVVDVSVARGLKVGYVMGVGDLVPQALDQLGVKPVLIDSDELAYGNLSGYNTIVLGIRAYERREDLRASNHRLLKYVQDGGTLIVQYNKTAEFNQAQLGPYPALVSNNRVTDENAPIEILDKEHQVFMSPNLIRQEAWAGWVQERGLYFLGQRDERYTDLVKLSDPFAYNAGDKTGALVEARYGKGRWIYLGLGLWRQLPYGTPGAYQLLANLISLGRPGLRAQGPRPQDP